jgi:hypothetical protein
MKMAVFSSVHLFTFLTIARQSQLQPSTKTTIIIMTDDDATHTGSGDLC